MEGKDKAFTRGYKHYCEDIVGSQQPDLVVSDLCFSWIQEPGPAILEGLAPAGAGLFHVMLFVGDER